MLPSILTAALVFLTGLLGFIWRGHSKAVARADALAEVILRKARAEQDHTKAMETIDAKEAKLQDADSLELSSAIDSLFGGGGSVPQDDAGGDGSGGAM